MVELLGFLLAAILFGLGALLWRLVRWLGRAAVRSGPRLGRYAPPGVSAPRRSALGHGFARLLGTSRPGHRMAALRGARLRAARARSRRQAERIAALVAALERARRDLRLAGMTRAAGTPGEDRFRRAKLAFAVHFHPDRLRCPEPERGIRTRIFQQFWQVLRRIERS